MQKWPGGARLPVSAAAGQSRHVPRLAGRKPEWLRSLARAALDGQLDAVRLRAMPVADALADLKKLPGIGDFSAGLETGEITGRQGHARTG